MERAEKSAYEMAMNNFKFEKQERLDQLESEKKEMMDHSVNPDDIITISYNPDKTIKNIILGGEVTTPAMVKILKEEIKAFRAFNLYKIFKSTLKDQARDIMFTKSQTFEDMRSGKMMLYNLSVIDNILDKIQKVK